MLCPSPVLLSGCSPSAILLNLTFSASLHVLLSQTRFRALPSAPEAACAGRVCTRWCLGACPPAELSALCSDLGTGPAMLPTEQPRKESVHEWTKESSSLLDPCSENYAVFALCGTHRDGHARVLMELFVAQGGPVSSTGHWLSH